MRPDKDDLHPSVPTRRSRGTDDRSHRTIGLAAEPRTIALAAEPARIALGYAVLSAGRYADDPSRYAGTPTIPLGTPGALTPETPRPP